LYAKWTRNEFVITLNVDNITDVNPVFDPICIGNGYMQTATVTVTESDYDAGSIEWSVAGVNAFPETTGTGASFTLNAQHVNYGTPGAHVLKLKVRVSATPYQINIPFTIVL
jgi:hypothetical protein